MSAMSRRPTAIVGSSDCVKSDGISSSGMSSEGVSYDVVSYEGVSYDGVSYDGVTGVCNTAVVRRWKFGRRELGRCYTRKLRRRMFNGVSIDGGSSNGGKFRRREILFPTAENSTSEGGKFDFRRRKHRCCGDCWSGWVLVDLWEECTGSEKGILRSVKAQVPDSGGRSDDNFGPGRLSTGFACSIMPFDCCFLYNLGMQTVGKCAYRALLL